MKTATRKEANGEPLGAALPEARGAEPAGTPFPPEPSAAFDPTDPLPGEVSRLLALYRRRRRPSRPAKPKPGPSCCSSLGSRNRL